MTWWYLQDFKGTSNTIFIIACSNQRCQFCNIYIYFFFICARCITLICTVVWKQFLINEINNTIQMSRILKQRSGMTAIIKRDLFRVWYTIGPMKDGRSHSFNVWKIHLNPTLRNVPSPCYFVTFAYGPERDTLRILYLFAHSWPLRVFISLNYRRNLFPQIFFCDSEFFVLQRIQWIYCESGNEKIYGIHLGRIFGAISCFSVTSAGLNNHTRGIDMRWIVALSHCIRIHFFIWFFLFFIFA